MFNTFICKLRGHNFRGWEYLASNSCEQVRICVRDDYEERRQARHDFTEWEYLASDSCEQVRACIRDGYKEHKHAPHIFSEWEYLTPDSCKQKRVCKRDGYIEERIAKHLWGEWSEWVEFNTSRERTCVCTRCGEENVQTESTWEYTLYETDNDHDDDEYGDWEGGVSCPVCAGAGVTTGKCSYCGSTMYQS